MKVWIITKMVEVACIDADTTTIVAVYGNEVWAESEKVRLEKEHADEVGVWFGIQEEEVLP